MKVIKITGIAIAAIILSLIVAWFFLPSNVIVERSVVIQAPVGVVYEQVADLKNWQKWSFWSKLDPEMKVEYDEATNGRGVNGKYCWEGDPENVGKGCLTITHAVPNESMNTLLQFEGMGEGRGSWMFEETAEGIKVSWAMNSDMTRPFFIGKFMGPMMDKMIGPKFEAGLASLKEVAESTPPESEAIVGEDYVKSQSILFIRDSSKLEGQAIGEKKAANYREILGYMEQNNLEMTGAPLAITNKFSIKENIWGFDAAIPVNTDKANPEGRVEFGKTYEGKVIKGLHLGPYETSTATYNAIEKYIQDHHFEIAGRPWESYVNNPGQVAPEDLRTFIYYPVRAN